MKIKKRENMRESAPVQKWMQDTTFVYIQAPTDLGEFLGIKKELFSTA